MDKSVKWMITIVVLFLVTMLTINLTRRSNYKKYINDNPDKIEYLYYEVRVDSLYNDTTYFYKLVDTLDDFNFFEINLKINDSRCYVVTHTEKIIWNRILDSDLKYSFQIKNSVKQPDSAIMSNLYHLNK